MAAQVPIVASHCGPVADIVEDGEQGFVVPLRDTQTLGDRLRLLAGICLSTATEN
jgi:glycosyltransferase involved in cell wall biosynthesis